MLSRHSARVSLLAASALVVACSALPAIEANQCGNGVLEPHEECDPGAPVASGKCGPQCRFICDDVTPCPAGYGCGVDSICRTSAGTFSTSVQRIAGELTNLRLGDFDGDGRQDIVVQGKTSLRIDFLDSQAALAKTTTLPVTRGRFITDSLSTDKLATITLLDTELAAAGAVGGNLMVFRGQPDRTVVPNLFSFVPLDVSDPLPIPARFGRFDLSGVGSVGQELAAIADTSPFTRERGTGYSLLFYDIRADGSSETIPIFPLPELDEWLLPNPAGANLPSVGSGTKQIDQPAVGHFILKNADGTSHTCESVILAVKDPSSVQVLPLCLLHSSVPDWRTGGTTRLAANTLNMYPYQLGPTDARPDPGPDATLEPRILLSLPAGATVGGGATIANVASYGVLPAVVSGPSQVSLFDTLTAVQDANPDVLVSIVGGAAVGFGDGTGAVYSSPPILGLVNKNTLTTYPGITVAANGAPLALGDLNGDLVVDWVDASGIHFNTVAYDRVIASATASAAAALQTPRTTLQTASVSAPGGATWTGAKIADLNNDGALDVVAWSGQSLDIYLGAARNSNNVVNPTFSRTSFPIDGTITHVALGDIDYDGLLDIAVAVHGDSSGLPTDALYVLFGRSGAPEAPRFLGRLNNVTQLVMGQLSWLLVGTPDSFQSIVPIGQTSSGVRFAAALQGSADRSLISRFGLASATNSYIHDVGFSVVAGKFLQPDASALPALVALGFGTERQVDDQSSASQSARLWLVPASGLADFDPSLVQSSTPFAEQGGNFTESPSDLLKQLNRAALAAVDLDHDGLDEVVAIIPSAAGFDQGRILTAKPSAFASPLPHDANGPGELTFVAFDFSAAGNVSTVVGDFDGDGNRDVLVASTDPWQTPYILLNDGSGQLDPARSVAVNVALGVDKVFAVTAAGELAVAVDGTVSFYRVVQGALVPGQTPAITLSSSGVVSMAVGDVNGDSIDDMVVGFPDAAEVYLGVAAIP